MSVAPVISPMLDSGIFIDTLDGAYYVVKGNLAAQIVVIGAMHFTPGEYVRALNDLLNTHFELKNSSFLEFNSGCAKTVLDRGFISLLAVKES